MGPDFALALSYVPARDRAVLRALFEIDAAMGDVVRTTSEPALGAIRLAWWRERLEDLDSGAVPAEPRLQSVVSQLLPRGVAGRDIAALEDGWLRLFDPFPWELRTAEAIRFRGRRLFGLAASVLGERSGEIEAAGDAWALTDAARHCSDSDSRAVLLNQARTLGREIAGTKIGSSLRPLSMLGVLAIRDAARGEPFEPEGTPRRAAIMLRHRMTGRL